MRTQEQGELARALAAVARRRSAPRHPLLHLDPDARVPQALLVDGSELVDLSPAEARAIEEALEGGDPEALGALLRRHRGEQAPRVDDQPLTDPPLHALSLAVAQSCNLACAYCYAQGGSFGGPQRRMEAEVGRRSIELLIGARQPGERVNISFLGGEPLGARALIRELTEHALALGRARGVAVHFSITTNGTLLQPEDGDLFAEHGFAVTVSLDGPAELHDQTRPTRGGQGSYDRIMERVRPLLARQRRMQVSARVTVTPLHRDLPEILDAFIAEGFHSVGFSPMLASPTGRAEMGPEDLDRMLEGMIGAGLRCEQALMEGRRYPFSNLLVALKELNRRTHRPYPCGAGAGYLAVSAEGELSACHRFVGEPAGRMGDLEGGVDPALQGRWLSERHVHRQQPCAGCWARYLCAGGCHHEVLSRGRSACDYIRGWLHYTLQVHSRLRRLAPRVLAALR